MSGAPVWLAVMVTVGGLVMALAPLLQLVRIMRMRSSADVSIGLFCVIGVGAALWMTYGIYEADAPLIIANALGTLTNLLVVTVAVRYRRYARAVRVIAEIPAER